MSANVCCESEVQRFWNPTWSFTRPIAGMDDPPGRVGSTSIGFSHSTCLPARAAAMATSA